ncbi:peptide-methionine (S)-S-oxide reductase MsrA [Aestuariivita sp.]|jgi:peptide-methionine (S)-S-oxide reductase|uniref:peptide-methionine (S)-S-oxide reductase MsrA n=1 Tax=Aestuariivita sp. TaxID=1872407 RepID=UPI002173844A|nr:peptide-methionine (S)-S-oxide reductase MsrA [Aestuariivita sp.]MCE8005501.1 peptide-methionine (S)-S-oxide reductase MsrA [Aestuariivita sp.]
MTLANNIKPLVLSVLIMMGLVVKANEAHAAQTETLTVAGGCFWCVEADFEKVPGVSEVISGFTGGSISNPTYKQVVGGDTGHVEAVQIQFDPSIVTRDELLSKFIRSVDPTDAGGQFCDRGFSYTTAIFVSNPQESERARAILAKAQKELGQSIVTPVRDIAPFYEAEAYHQDYYKSRGLIITRAGPKSKANAYKFYREACGRDQRVRELWGSAAPFADG